MGCIYGNGSYSMSDKFKYQGYVDEEDLVNIHKAFSRGALTVWNVFANEWFTEAQQEEWERGNCNRSTYKSKSESEYFNDKIRGYIVKYRQFISNINGPTNSINNIGEICKEKNLYFDSNNPFTWSQPFYCHEEWCNILKKDIWGDGYLRDCYYTMLNPVYPKLMYEIYKMYKSEKGEEPNIFNREETLRFRHNCPSTWEEVTNYDWHFLIEVFSVKEEDYGALQHFIMLLLNEKCYNEYRGYYFRLHPFDRFDIFKISPEKYIDKILSHPRALNFYTPDYEKRVKKWEEINRKFLKLLNKIQNI